MAKILMKGITSLKRWLNCLVITLQKCTFDLKRQFYVQWSDCGLSLYYAEVSIDICTEGCRPLFSELSAFCLGDNVSFHVYNMNLIL